MKMAKDNFSDDTKEIYDELIERCQQARYFYVPCLVDESWVYQNPIPFDIRIVNGVYICRVVASTLTEALLIVVENIPVIKFVDPDEIEDEEDE
jgi:hypothetical protein